MKRLLFSLIALCLLCSNCRTKQDNEGRTAVASDTIRYASGLHVDYFDGYTAVDIKDPWEEGKLLQRYILVERGQPLPGNLPAGTVVRVPLENVVVYTSVHAAIIDLLGESRRIAGVCEPRYMDIPSIREGIKEGRIADLGEATNPNVEKMIGINAGVVIASPFQNGSYGAVGKTGIPVIEGADYMESLPLGRAEWIRFYGLLFKRKHEADSIFRETEKRYLELKEIASKTDYRPTVITEKRFGSTWHIPAGNSYVANLLRDAGANYLFDYLPGTGSLPYPFEAVFEKGWDADLWLIKYNGQAGTTYKELRGEYAPYENFRAFKERNIYTCNTGKVPYYEESPIYPDHVLKDLVWIFHPSLLPDYTPRYYRKMEE